MRTAAQRGWKLHGYQELARSFLAYKTGGRGLFLDMGLGKTAAALAALGAEQLPALVVAPKKVAEATWPTESALWRPDLRVVVAKGSPAERLSQLARDDVDVVVIGRENMGDALKVRRRTKFRTVIIDELSGYKTRSSTRWKVARKITTRASVKYVWGLTGTPSPNGLMDLWAPMYLLDGGQRLGTTLTGFRELHFRVARQLPNGVVTKWEIREGHDKLIHAKIEDICLSMATEGRIELPPTTYNDIEIDLSPKVRAVYKEMKKELIVDIRDIFGGEIHSVANAAALTSKLSQIAAGFMYVDDADIRDGAWSELHREKIDAVAKVVEETGSPVLVFYRFKVELEMLKDRFGDEAHTIDEDGVIDAWNEGQIPILLAHPQSAGHGLNLQHGGHTIVWASLTWSLEEWEQGNKRLSRQGQSNPVVIHSIMARKTIDQLIRARLGDKAEVQDALLAHLESPI